MMAEKSTIFDNKIAIKRGQVVNKNLRQKKLAAKFCLSPYLLKKKFSPPFVDNQYCLRISINNYTYILFISNSSNNVSDL